MLKLTNKKIEVERIGMKKKQKCRKLICEKCTKLNVHFLTSTSGDSVAGKFKFMCIRTSINTILHQRDMSLTCCMSVCSNFLINEN